MAYIQQYQLLATDRYMHRITHVDISPSIHCDDVLSNSDLNALFDAWNTTSQLVASTEPQIMTLKGQSSSDTASTWTITLLKKVMKITKEVGTVGKQLVCFKEASTSQEEHCCVTKYSEPGTRPSATKAELDIRLKAY